MVDMRVMSVTLTEVHSEAGAPVSPPTRKVVAAAVVTNPLAAKPLVSDDAVLDDLPPAPGFSPSMGFASRRASADLGGGPKLSAPPRPMVARPAIAKPLPPAAPRAEHSPWRMSVAPMMDWTDRHCRYFHRLLTRQTLLYTEMVNAGAIIHGGTERHLRFNAEEHPVALQLGGNEPDKLAEAARLGAQWGYGEINLNCGCPSDRVQRGAFGASLMKSPQLVADCVKAMKDVVSVPVTVKHRIGIDKVEDYGFVRDFIGTVAEAGCTVFIVHARNAWLQGLSPKENRDVPPLRYEVVHRLKAEFPQFTIAINGGIQTDGVVLEQLDHLDGVMIGREAYHNPWWLARWDQLYYGGAPCPLTREEVELAMVEYMEREAAVHGTPWPHIARHMLGLRHSLPGARIWRQVWSNHLLKDRPAREVHALAMQAYANAPESSADPAAQALAA